MTCVNETKEATNHYTMLHFVEFLEMIGRVAHLKFSAEHGAPEEVVKQDLSQKIEAILEIILAVIGVKPLPPVVTNLDESESDDDY